MLDRKVGQCKVSMAATADADVANAIRMGEAKVAGAKYLGAGTEAQGAAAGHSAMMGGISSGLSGALLED